MAGKPKLLVLELWGLGDLVIASPFLLAAANKFDVVLLAKPFALELQPHLWSAVRVIPFVAPWTAFRHKYHFWRWPWRDMLKLHHSLKAEKFDYAISARWDPRDHLLMKLSGARNRLGFPRLKSQRWLTQPLCSPEALSHRSESWKIAGQALGLDMSAKPAAVSFSRLPAKVIIHTGARVPVRVWPLEKFRVLAERLREKMIPVQIVCDPNQLEWWHKHGEQPACPANVSELITLVKNSGTFIGNDSGPGHLAAAWGVPTFTIFGPQLSEWFAPVTVASEVFEGKACPYKPCSDYCRYPKPFCLHDIDADEVWRRVEKFVERNLPPHLLANL